MKHGVAKCSKLLSIRSNWAHFEGCIYSVTISSCSRSLFQVCAQVSLDLLCIGTRRPNGHDNSRLKTTLGSTVYPPVSTGGIGVSHLSTHVGPASSRCSRSLCFRSEKSMRLRRICVRCHVVTKVCLHHLTTTKLGRVAYACDVVYALGNLKQHCCEFETRLL